MNLSKLTTSNNNLRHTCFFKNKLRCARNQAHLKLNWFQTSLPPQTCQHVTVDCDSIMLSMENITWGWRGVQQRMAQGKAVVVDSDWLIWLVRWLKGLWTVELSQITWWGFAAITSGGSIRSDGSLTGFSFWWTLDTTPTPSPALTEPLHTQTGTHTHSPISIIAYTHT